ncbi:MAG TPA: spore maturation protein, partial [Clostridiales bacterium]|nr:spore maturation protein [Clostridiales bacterium]
TFYVLSVYFGAAGVRKTRHAVPAALCADLAGFLAAALCVNVLHL